MQKSTFILVLVAVAVFSMIFGAVGTYTVLSLVDKGETSVDPTPEPTIANSEVDEATTYKFSTVDDDFEFELTGDYSFEHDFLMLSDADDNAAYVNVVKKTDLHASIPGTPSLTDYALAVTANQCTGTEVITETMTISGLALVKVIDANDCGNSDTGMGEYYQVAYVRSLGSNDEYLGVVSYTSQGFDLAAMQEVIASLRVAR
jgi:hypothetical protein